VAATLEPVTRRRVAAILWLAALVILALGAAAPFWLPEVM
jgi:hypothetical protein